MPIFAERHPCRIEAWVSQPGLVIERGPGYERLVLPSTITRHGKVYPVKAGDYVYLDRDGNWDACPKAHFEGAYVLDAEPDCRCVDTLRGLDRAGCPRHDPEDDDAPAQRQGGGEEGK